MSLNEFVNQVNVKEKFEIAFKPVFKDKYQIKTFRPGRLGNRIRKDNVGIYFLFHESKIKLICDTYGRIREISCIEDLTRFLTYSKYQNNLCWIYIDSFNFDSLLNYLPEQEFEDLKKNGMVIYHSHIIGYQKNENFTVTMIKSNQEFKFYNLFPFFNLHLESAARKFLDFPINDSGESEIFENNIRCWHELNDRIINYCLKNAKIIQNLADYSVENNYGSEFKTIKKIINPPLTDNYPLVGTAFDYLFRFIIEANNSNAITRRWVAYNSLDFLDSEESEIAASILGQAEKEYSHFLKTKVITDNLISRALHLAKLDVISRRDIQLKDIDMRIDPRDIADLKNLIKGIPQHLYSDKRICILNPTFGLASDLVGGADADLILDNILIDIKTTKDPKFTTSYFNQLMGYVLLHHLNCIYSKNFKFDENYEFFDEEFEDQEKKIMSTKIEKIGVYFARFNYLYSINLKDILPDGIMDWKILVWFEKEAYHEYRPIGFKKYFKKSNWRKLDFGKIPVNEVLYPNH